MYRKRLILSVIGATCLSAVLIALISQYQFDMQPCAWCVFQRFIYLLIAIVCFSGVFIFPSRPGVAVTSAVSLALSLGGITSAWYQAQVASNSFSCAQTLADQFVTRLGLDETMPWLFGIYASCMDARVKVFGLEYAYWSLILFVMIGAASTALLRRLTWADIKNN
jgi:disulfide bond formation protein DsbB